MLLTLINEIYSYNKELDSSFEGNIVYQLQNYAKCLPRAAMALAERMFEEEKRKFDQNCEAIERKYDDNREVKRYIRSMRALATGHYYLCTNYQRYTVANERAENLSVQDVQNDDTSSY